MRKNDYSGWHLTLDAHVHESAPIADIEHLRKTLLELVSLLGMNLLDGPRMTEVPLDESELDSDADEGGITGYCLITTSHISIHTWPLRSRFCLDIFSCKCFDHHAALEFIRERLGVSESNVAWVERRWPITTESAAARS